MFVNYSSEVSVKADENRTRILPIDSVAIKISYATIYSILLIASLVGNALLIFACQRLKTTINLIITNKAVCCFCKEGGPSFWEKRYTLHHRFARLTRELLLRKLPLSGLRKFISLKCYQVISRKNKTKTKNKNKSKGKGLFYMGNTLVNPEVSKNIEYTHKLNHCLFTDSAKSSVLIEFY